MKQINKCRALSLVILTVLIGDCVLADDVFKNIGYFTTTSTVGGFGVSSRVTSYSDPKHGAKTELQTASVNDTYDKLMRFLQSNWSNLKSDMARGQGQNLTALAGLLKIDYYSDPYFYVMCKKNFTQLVPDSHTTPEQFLHNLGYNKDFINRNGYNPISFEKKLDEARNAAITSTQKNWLNLKADMARGQGQYLIEIAEILYFPDAKKAAFYAMSKDNFTALFPTSDTTATELVHKLEIERDMVVFYPDDTAEKFANRYFHEIFHLDDTHKERGLYLSIMANKLKIPTSKKAAFYTLIKTKFSNRGGEDYQTFIKRFIAEAAKL